MITFVLCYLAIGAGSLLFARREIDDINDPALRVLAVLGFVLLWLPVVFYVIPAVIEHLRAKKEADAVVRRIRAKPALRAFSGARLESRARRARVARLHRSLGVPSGSRRLLVPALPRWCVARVR